MHNLKDYRCDCGKLLFKGVLFLSAVEVKCRRCGTVQVFDDALGGGQITFTLFVRKNGVVSDTCRVADALGIGQNAYQNRVARDIFPILRDAPFSEEVPHEKGTMYHNIPKSVLTCKDGHTLEAESSVIPHYKEDALDGFRIFNMLYR